MTWKVSFDAALDADLQVVSFELAHAASRAVLRFAETSVGTAYPIDIDSSLWRFFVPGGFALVRADPETSTLRFLRIVASEEQAPFEPLLELPELDQGED